MGNNQVESSRSNLLRNNNNNKPKNKLMATKTKRILKTNIKNTKNCKKN